MQHASLLQRARAAPRASVRPRVASTSAAFPVPLQHPAFADLATTMFRSAPTVQYLEPSALADILRGNGPAQETVRVLDVRDSVSRKAVPATPHLGARGGEPPRQGGLAQLSAGCRCRLPVPGAPLTQASH
jgi:hypothetical protein